MSLDYIRRTYDVPAKRGGRVRYYGAGRDQFGTIVGTGGGHLHVKLDGQDWSAPYHPTWKLEYLSDGASALGAPDARVEGPGMNQNSLPNPDISAREALSKARGDAA